VRTTTRASNAVPITIANVPAIAATAGANAIVVSSATVDVPN
jgi:hydroxybutyrate-dimer hydrolase